MSTDAAEAPWRVDHVELRFELALDRVEVTSTLHVVPAGNGDAPLVLDGAGFETLELLVDGAAVHIDDSVLTPTALTLKLSPGPHTVTTRVALVPASLNSKGLVHGPSLLFTDCEPQGFRRITWSIDRPDNRATFDVTLVGDPELFPVMLSNGDRIDSGTLDGRHWVRYRDPINKPTYLFSMVAGDLRLRSRTRTAPSGRTIRLTVAAPPDLIDGADFALDLLDRAMAFDEANGGIEHDLDELTLVAVPGYNDATEYHGLMFFEPSLLVTDPRGSVDDDLLLIAANVAHEYGHHVRGNRITVSAWRELALKEGLTVLEGQNDFRRHWLGDAARVLDVLDLRRLQYPEEVTMGVPVLRPEVPDPRVLYNRTTYLKGAEIFGMIRTVVGAATWRAIVAAFVERHDLGAASIDDFLEAARRAAPDHVADIDGIARWFTRVGRPALEMWSDQQRVSFRRTDTLDDDPAVAIPLRLGFRGVDGSPLPVGIDGVVADEHLVMVTSRDLSVAIESPQHFVMSPMRGFSAPVDVECNLSSDELGVLVEHESDPFTRWWASQELMIRVVDAVRAGRVAEAIAMVDVLATALRSASSTVDDPILLANLLSVPDEFMLGDRDPQIDVDGVAAGLDELRRSLGTRLHDDVMRVLSRFVDNASGASPRDIGIRWLVEPALALLLASGSDEGRRFAIDAVSDRNDTRAVRALTQVMHSNEIDVDGLLSATYQRWEHAPKLVDRWLRAQSGARRSDTVARVQSLAAGPLYDRSSRTRVMAVWFPFATRNRSVFHSISGEGYRTFVDELGELMPVNAGLAVRLVGDLLQFKRFDPQREALLRAELERMADMNGMPDFAVGILRNLLA